MQLQDLPSVTELANRLAAVAPGVPDTMLIEASQRAVSRAREILTRGGESDPYVLAEGEVRHLAASRPVTVVNATGVLLHTNLGRAPVAAGAARQSADHAAHYSNLEFDLATGRRGGRGRWVATLLASLTGAEDALVVNNNAAALLLALAALAGGGSTVVSRGELIEIGGSFRLPDLMASSGTTLLEVGTTNRTRLSDYESVADRADLVLKVHPSNYRIEGFTEEASYAELGAIAQRLGVPFVADVGSGLLDTRTPWLEGPPPPWLQAEPGVRQTLEAGADIVLFSGDKLLGGPQAGIAVGSTRLITEMRRHPLARALRSDGPTLAALGATLELYATGRGRDVPFWRMATLDSDTLMDRLEAIATHAPGASIVEGTSVPGAGTVPGVGIPTPVLQIPGDAEKAWRDLVEYRPAIVARRTRDGLVIDVRTVAPEDDHHLIAALDRHFG